MLGLTTSEPRRVVPPITAASRAISGGPYLTLRRTRRCSMAAGLLCRRHTTAASCSFSHVRSLMQGRRNLAAPCLPRACQRLCCAPGMLRTKGLDKCRCLCGSAGIPQVLPLLSPVCARCIDCLGLHCIAERTLLLLLLLVVAIHSCFLRCHLSGLQAAAWLGACPHRRPFRLVLRCTGL